MPLLTLTDARLAFGHHRLLDAATLQVDAGERVGLIGRNGTGKSSLLKVIAERIRLDDGELWIQSGARIAYVPQEPDLDSQQSIFDAVALGLGDEGALLTQYHHATADLAANPDNSDVLEQVGMLQAELDRANAWSLGNRVDAVLSRLALSPDILVASLSGGWKKRVSLAQALASEPDVLLLDEPTNHLDFEAIEWLESLLKEWAGAVICITHDRRFLDTIATRIVELDRGVLRSFPGSFAAYQDLKAQQLVEEAIANAKFDKVLAQEEVWIRKGIEARRTRNEGRVRRLEQLRLDRAARRDRLGQVNLKIGQGERSGQLVAELKHVSKSFNHKTVLRDFSTRILRGDRIGLIGPNGIGKSTLLKLILGEIEPDSGTVRHGTNLAIAYFDQLREQLDPEATVQDTINPGADWVEVAGQRKHVISYLGDFLFPPERARSPVKSLSGGERNRVLLARLFAKTANVLMLDEPTNDLDIETLELLEALLQDYRGTLFLVSHDRTFLDNVVTQTIAFEGGGVLREYAGGYSDWAAYQARRHIQDGAVASGKANSDSGTAQRQTRREKNSLPLPQLSGQQQKELADLPGRIEAWERQLGELNTLFADQKIYRKPAQDLKKLRQQLRQVEADVAAAYQRWDELEKIKQTSAAEGSD